MRRKSPEKMKKIVEIIERWKLKEGVEPSVAQIAADAGMSKGRVHDYLHDMDAQGIISYSPGNCNTPRTRMISKTANTAPIVGSVKCGDPQLEEAEILEYVRLPSAIFGNSEMYILIASGDSMVDAGIDDGDTIVVENRLEAKKNDIVVAMDDEGCNTLKRYKGTKSGKARLAYENEERYPGRELLLDAVRIQGIARFVIKKL